VQTNGSPSADSIGGTFSFFAGAQIEKPLVGETISVVVFTDTGTLLNEVSLDEYRASVGIGLRLYIPQLGPVPLAFDFARAFVREDFDQTRLFSFSLDVPF
jgi:outer membrane protein insertion porin family